MVGKDRTDYALASSLFNMSRSTVAAPIAETLVIMLLHVVSEGSLEETIIYIQDCCG